MIPYPEGRLFVYGTLMIDEVVKQLLGQPMPSKDAVLYGYERKGIRRGEKGAKGPVLFPSSKDAFVRGKVLEDVDHEAQRVLNLFEDAAGGYDLIEVVVKVQEDGLDLPVARRAAVFCGRPKLRMISSGEWSREEFESKHLRGYVEDRIPRLLEEWKSAQQPAASELRTRMTTEEKQVLYLKRNWDLLESFKRMRTRVPAAISASMITVTGFAVKGKYEFEASASVLTALAVAGAFRLWITHGQYNYTEDKIENLYQQLGMDMTAPCRDFRHSKRPKPEGAKDVFIVGYLFLAAIWLLCVVLVAISPSGSTH